MGNKTPRHRKITLQLEKHGNFLVRGLFKKAVKRLRRRLLRQKLQPDWNPSSHTVKKITPPRSFNMLRYLRLDEIT